MPKEGRQEELTGERKEVLWEGSIVKIEVSEKCRRKESNNSYGRQEELWRRGRKNYRRKEGETVKGRKICRGMQQVDERRKNMKKDMRRFKRYRRKRNEEL